MREITLPRNLGPSYLPKWSFYDKLGKFGAYMNSYAIYSITHRAEIIAAPFLSTLMISLSWNGLNWVSAHVVKGQQFSNCIESVLFIRSLRNLVRTLTILRSTVPDLGMCHGTGPPPRRGPPVPDLPWWRPLCHELVEAHVPSEIYLFFGIGSQNTQIFLPENSEDPF